MHKHQDVQEKPLDLSLDHEAAQANVSGKIANHDYSQPLDLSMA